LFGQLSCDDRAEGRKAVPADQLEAVNETRSATPENATAAVSILEDSRVRAA
jgi:hypothetical protein